MRVPVSWLGEYVDIAGYSIEELDAAFVRQGLEVEAIHRPQVTGPLVVGEVVSVEVLTEFKKPIRHCHVNVGEANVDGAPRSIVCGASNFAEGDWVVVALPGAVLPEGFAIASRKTYGRLSDGMICSARELGLGDDHTGIIVLDKSALPNDTKPGDDAIKLLGLDETVIELAITPDIGYCLSMRGVAREISHALNHMGEVRYRDPGLVPTPDATEEPAYPVRVVDRAGCDRFVGRVVRGIDPTAKTPQWMKSRLVHAGMRPISLAVDITNYLMFELGQPMHTYDVTKLSGEIVVRRAEKGEKLRTLDGVERKLDPDDLLITDDTGPIGLAAVMGGASTEVSTQTTDLFIECAHFDPVTVSRAARRHKLPSEASKRFERGVDPAMTAVAAQRAVELLAELAGGVADEHVLDIDTRKPEPTIVLDTQLPSRIAGVVYGGETVEKRLREIGCLTTVNGERLAVTPPSWRPDLTVPVDLVEEVLRLEGYDAIPATLPPAPSSSGLTASQRRDRRIADTVSEAGYVEVLTYPFVGEQVNDAFRIEPDDERRHALRLANPLSEQEPLLRTWLLPNLLETAKRNISRGQRDLALFETGLVYFADEQPVPAPRLGVTSRPSDVELKQLWAAIPEQRKHIAFALTGKAELASWWGNGRAADWSDAVDAARLVAEAAGVEIVVEQADRAPWHPGRCARIRVAGEKPGAVLGYAGELHPAIVADLGLPQGTCAAELSVDAFPPSQPASAPTLANYPPALIDLALVVAEQTPASAVERALRTGAGDLLEQCVLFDVFTGEQVGEGRKSLAYSLTFRASDRTLTVAEATQARDAAVEEAARQVGAQLRD